MNSNWKKTPLKEIYKGFYDGPHATPKISDKGAIFLGIKNISKNGYLDLSNIRYIAEDDMPKWTKRVTPQKNDIVFSYEATLHRYALIPDNFRGCLGRRMALIRVDENKANIKFLFSYFLSPIWRCEVEKYILSGATVDRIPITNVPNFTVFLPPLPTQQKIAQILSAYDDLIENTLKGIKLLEEMAQITYEQWFVRMKFPNHDNTAIDNKTGLPEGWSVIPLDDVADITSSKRIFLSDYVENGIPFFRGKEIILKSKNETITDQLYISHDRFLDIKKSFGTPCSGDILIAAVGTLGYPYLVTEKDDEFYFKDGNLIWLRSINNSAISNYLINVFKNPIFKHELDAITIGSSQKALTIKSLKRLKVLFPSDKILKEFSDKAIPISNLINTLLKKNQYLKEARDILLPRLMTGMIDVDKIILPKHSSHKEAKLNDL